MSACTVAPSLYHGGAPGFRVGETITPHESKHIDGCPICEVGADDNHLPDRVFATPVRLYAKLYASKWGMGWLYRVEHVGELQRSEVDTIETYHAASFRVVSVCDRAVLLTPSERRHLYRMWTAADRANGAGETSVLAGRQLMKALGFRGLAS